MRRIIIIYIFSPCVKKRSCQFMKDDGELAANSCFFLEHKKNNLFRTCVPCEQHNSEAFCLQICFFFTRFQSSAIHGTSHQFIKLSCAAWVVLLNIISRTKQKQVHKSYLFKYVDYRIGRKVSNGADDLGRRCADKKKRLEIK